MTATAGPFTHDDRAVSASKVSLWRDCRLAYRFTHVDGLESARGRPQELGDVVHRALAEVALYAKSLGHARVRAEVAVAFVKTADAGLLREARELVAASIERLDLSHVVAVERPWSLPLGEGLTARGITDLVRFDPEWGDAEVLDHKSGFLVKHRRLEDDPQCLLYLAAERARFGDNPPRQIAYRQFWWRLRELTQPVFWTPELDERARALARTVLREIATEAEWAPSSGAACRGCRFIDRCSAHAEDAPPSDARLSLDDVVKKAVLYRARAKAWARRADELSAHVEAVAAIAGPFVAGGVPVDVVERKGRRVWPAGDGLEHALRAAGFEPPALSRAEGKAVSAWIKTLARELRGDAWRVVEAVAKRGLPSTRVVLGGSVENDEEDEA